MADFTITQTPNAKTIYLYPNGSGCTTQLTPFGESNNYACIDEDYLSPDDDGTYVYSSATGEVQDLYTLEDSTITTGTILYVKVFARAKSASYAQSSSGVYKILVSDSTCTLTDKSDDIDLVTSYKDYSYTLTENPMTSTNWTWTDINNLQVGIECSSPTVNALASSLSLDDDGTDTIEDIETGSSYWYTDYWQTGGCGIGVSNGDEKCILTFQNSPTTDASNVITNVTVIADFNTDVGRPHPKYYCAYWGGTCYYCNYSNETPVANLLFKINGTEYNGTNFNLYYGRVTKSFSYSSNPDTGSAWTWSDINNLSAGALFHDFNDSNFIGAAHLMYKNIHIVVDYLGAVNPQIRTTQVYAIVSYQPDSEEANLNKPTEISRDHSRNINMINFWNGTREVYSLSRNSKTTVLKGAEYGSGSCDRLLAIREMGLNGGSVELSGLNLCSINTSYKIRSFGIKKISDKPYFAEWILELEEEGDE